MLFCGPVWLMILLMYAYDLRPLFLRSRDTFLSKINFRTICLIEYLIKFWKVTFMLWSPTKAQIIIDGLLSRKRKVIVPWYKKASESSEPHNMSTNLLTARKSSECSCDVENLEEDATYLTLFNTIRHFLMLSTATWHFITLFDTFNALWHILKRSDIFNAI